MSGPCTISQHGKCIGRPNGYEQGEACEVSVVGGGVLAASLSFQVRAHALSDSGRAPDTQGEQFSTWGLVLQLLRSSMGKCSISQWGLPASRKLTERPLALRFQTVDYGAGGANQWGHGCAWPARRDVVSIVYSATIPGAAVNPLTEQYSGGADCDKVWHFDLSQPAHQVSHSTRQPESTRIRTRHPVRHTLSIYGVSHWKGMCI